MMIFKEFSRIVCVSLFSYQSSFVLLYLRQLVYFIISIIVCQYWIFNFFKLLKQTKYSKVLWRLSHLQNYIHVKHHRINWPRSSWSSPHPISSSQLHALPHFHPCPINLVVFKGVYSFRMGYLILRGGFTLRCLQRLSLPGLATRL